MRAWGKGECRILPTSMPGMARSSVYLPAPVVLPAASTMAMGFPIIEKSVIRCWSLVVHRWQDQNPHAGISLGVQVLFGGRHSLLFGVNCRLDCLIHLAITG